jgi:hypothetical protein
MTHVSFFVGGVARGRGEKQIAAPVGVPVRNNTGDAGRGGGVWTEVYPPALRATPL